MQTEASSFCKTCEDPEPMCETCAEHHTLQQISRCHELSTDIQELSSRFDKSCVYVFACQMTGQNQSCFIQICNVGSLQKKIEYNW